MLVIPAIDIKDGRCVRLNQGRFEEQTVYFDDPVKTARLWRRENAKVLHVVDLDGALDGLTSRNLEAIRGIVEGVDIPVQLGGGIRSEADADRMLNLGVYRIILGTVAVEQPELVERLIKLYGPRRILVGIDARDGIVMTKGWLGDSGVSAVELAKEMKARGVERIVYTDISRDGTMQGPNIEQTATLAREAKVRVTASGGVGGVKDLFALQSVESAGVDSVIVGRALYENRFPCQMLWRMCETDLRDAPTESVRPDCPKLKTAVA